MLNPFSGFGRVLGFAFSCFTTFFSSFSFFLVTTSGILSFEILSIQSKLLLFTFRPEN